ncbi:indole-3-glycerol phosphate synthase TrpC [Anaerotignum sp. MB30-C6]|uniref:indole-3-glycerol phosphate synthase TrpC n=1 Tax=Anaerotignum sp. MB30-C6 TaxID=3070814 RepID=UPI0027DB4FAF|nr:indole-3-glycerol phosphate synthase TrpC [Anaerotignum sp. MB30-C6]WMI82617.1 indole-3-glycerol phosphate synthase TrpC [Anaerotignum sp. MB30-C6]
MFLDKIMEYTQKRMDNIKSQFDFPFQKALEQDGMSFICEIKKASPSKGVIAEDFPYLSIAKEYEQTGAAAISILTEPKFFKGSIEYLKEVSSAVKTPTLRKDFIIDPYQIYEAKLCGASAVLLIAEILEEEKLKAFLNLAESLGLSVLVESHSLPQLKKSLRCGAKIVGVNNRNLETFEVDMKTSLSLRAYVPDDVLYVVESGIKTPEDIKLLSDYGVDGVLIGETLMRSKDKVAMMSKLRSLL